MTDMEERVARLDTMIEEGRIIRHEWTDGHERACLLAALSPEVARDGNVGACPAHVMPVWLAHLTPWIDDEVSDEAWPRIIRRYADLARRWHRLDGAAWERARIASLIAIVAEARAHCPDDEARALSAIDRVLEWLRRGAPESERVAVRDAAAGAAVSWSVVLAGEAARRAAASAASAAEVARAAKAARAAASAASAAEASRAAGAAASDRIAAAVLDAIEAEIERSER
jgi:hypothetical protein